MNIKELFYKPLDRAINGVVKADQNDNTTVYQELDEYVVTNELEKHFRDFFQSYGTDLSDPSIANRVGVWISGFFGSCLTSIRVLVLTIHILPIWNVT